MARILVDTTYLLPLAGIEIEPLPRDALSRLKALGHSLYVSRISIFELLAKAAKLAALGKTDDERILSALQAIMKSTDIALVEADGIAAASIALKARRYHPDFIDCLILATALIHAEVLLTEDRMLLKPGEHLKEMVLQENRRFRILTFSLLTKS